jgi:hypothetical protein
MPHLAAALLGILWCALGIAKALQPDALTEFLRSQFGTAAGPVVWSIVLLELALGLVLIVSCRSTGAWGRYSRMASIAYTVALAGLLLFGGNAVRSCGCLGAIQADEASRKLAVLGCLLILGTAALGSASRSGGDDVAFSG